MIAHALHCTVYFPGTDYSPVTVNSQDALSVSLTLQNSPILFGCRTGICGTCLVSATGEIAEPGTDEQEVLDILAPTCSTARLACQIKCRGDLSLTPLKP